MVFGTENYKILWFVNICIMSSRKLIDEYPGIISDIQTEIKKLENDTRVLNKLYVILDVLHDEPIKDIINKHGISQGTAYNWIKQWNNGGMESRLY